MGIWTSKKLFVKKIKAFLVSTVYIRREILPFKTNCPFDLIDKTIS